ncbi:MAG: TrpR-like protein YerC/YecD [Parcubacteria group bacterium Greene0416_79]|nr:MAG: TrpR-like protein YerC/YecD [Parcubacteria group bacterium Greene0416_79]
MARAKPQLIPSKERQQLLHEFWTAIALLETVDEINNFFKDLLSETEAVMLARRLKIAKLITHGYDYDEIAKIMHASSATIASVHSWLDGGFGGYRESVRKLETELKRQAAVQEKREKLRDPFSFESLKKKYPLHFLLFNVADDLKYHPPRKLRK